MKPKEVDIHEQVLEKVSKFNERWFTEVVQVRRFAYAPTKNPKRRKRPLEATAIDVFRRRLCEIVVKDIRDTFCLERCGLLLPVPGRTGLWRLAENVGYPSQLVDERKTYCAGIGLSGLALAGELVRSDSILDDSRRSKAHGDSWKNGDGTPVTNTHPRSLLAVPIWNQPSDLYRTTLGAIVAIRQQAFSKSDEYAMSLTASAFSTSYQGLESYNSKLAISQVNADLTSIWAQRTAIDERLTESLKLLKRILPCNRMLLSRIDHRKGVISGAATIGFKSSLIGETERLLHPKNPEHADILSQFYAEGHTSAEVFSRLHPAVHVMTALRHELSADLLLIPLISTSQKYLGIIAVELVSFERDISRLSPNELERYVLFGRQVADHWLMAREAWLATEIENLTYDGSTDSKGRLSEHIHSCNLLASTVIGCKHAATYSFDAQSGCLEQVAANDCSGCKFDLPISLFNHPDDVSHPLMQCIIKRRAVSVPPKTPGEVQSHRDSGIAIPLIAKDTVCGVLVVSAENGELASLPFVEPASNADIRKIIPLTTAACLQWSEAKRQRQLSRESDAKRAIFHILGRVARARQSWLPSLHKIIDSLRNEFDALLQNISSIISSELCELFIPETPVMLDKKGQIPSALFDTPFTNVVRYFASDTVVEQERRKVIKNYTRQAGGSGLTASVLQTMSRQISKDVTEDPLWTGTSHEFPKDQPRSWLGIPLVYEFDGDLHCWGILCATRLRRSKKDSRYYGDDELLIATHLGDCVAMSLARLFDRGALDNRAAGLLARFDHDIPDLILYLRNQVSQFGNGGSPKRRDKLSLGLEALQACVSALLIAHAPPGASLPATSVCKPSRVKRQLVELCSLDSVKGRTRILYEMEDDAKCQCVVDEEYLMYCILILIKNSLRGCVERQSLEPNFCGTVDVEFKPVQGCLDNWYRVMVRDDGAGFPREVGDPNYVDEGRSFWRTGKKGLGRGRSIVRRLVTAMGGCNLLWERTSEMGGVCVSFLLKAR